MNLETLLAMYGCGAAVVLILIIGMALLSE